MTKVSEVKVLEDIQNMLNSTEETTELAKRVENSYIALYHQIDSMEKWDTGKEIYYGSKGVHTITFKKDREGKQYFKIYHNTSEEGDYCINITLKEDKIIAEELSFCLTCVAGDFEKLFRFYSKRKGKGVAKRIKSIISLPKETLEAVRKERELLQQLREGGGLEVLLQQSEEGIFDISLVKNAYYTNPEAFKQLFEAATGEQKKQVVQELIKTKEANKEVDKWLEGKYGEIAEYAGMEQFAGEKDGR